MAFVRVSSWIKSGAMDILWLRVAISYLVALCHSNTFAIRILSCHRYQKCPQYVFQCFMFVETLFVRKLKQTAAIESEIERKEMYVIVLASLRANKTNIYTSHANWAIFRNETVHAKNSQIMARKHIFITIYLASSSSDTMNLNLNWVYFL